MVRNMQPATAKLDAFIRKKIKNEGIPGMTVAVTDRDRILWRREYGYANADRRRPVDANTLFQIGSISKSFASIALLQLVERGKVDLHRPVRHYLPWLEVKSKHRPITLHHLLSHTAGMVTGTERTTEGRSEIWNLKETEASRPGEMFHYSNVGYKIVGEVISSIEGKSCARVLQERLVRPLRMRSTSTEITHDIRTRSAVGYWPLYDDRPMRNVPEWIPCTWIESDTSDGSISSTSEDMCAYVRMLLNRGKSPEGRILSQRSYRQLTQRVIRCDDSHGEEYYGYGLSVAPYRGHVLVGHTGGMPGFISSMRLDIDEGIGAFASTNCRRTVDDVTRMAIELLRRSRHGESLSEASRYALPVPPNMDDFTGTYSSSRNFLEIRKVGGHLILRLGNEQIPLEWREGDSFFADSPAMEKHLLSFGRDRGKVVEAFHGDDWYTNAKYRGRKTFSCPKEWERLKGHYRSHNPWLTNFRVVLRKGSLALVQPDSPTEPLTPIGNNLFRVGADKRSPERICFSAFVDGEPQIAHFSGCEFARSFIP